MSAFKKTTNARNSGVGGKIVDVLTNAWLVAGTCAVIVLGLQILG